MPQLIGAVPIALGCTLLACWQWAFPHARRQRLVPRPVEVRAHLLLQEIEDDADCEDEEDWGAYGQTIAAVPQQDGSSQTVTQTDTVEITQSEQETPPQRDGSSQTDEVAATTTPASVRQPGHGLLGSVHLPRGRQAAAKRAASHVKASLGLPRYTEANAMVVGRLVRDLLSERGVRPKHIAAIAPVAVSLVFLPTKHDIYAKQLLASSAAAAQREAMDAEYYTEMHGEGPLGALRWRQVKGPVMGK